MKQHFSSTPTLLLAVCLVLLAGCKEHSTGPENPNPNARVEVTAPKTELWLEDTLQLTATVTSGTGEPIDQPQLVWSSDQPDILEVNNQGMITALDTGEATITATYENTSGRITLKIFGYALVYTSTVNDAHELFYLELGEGAAPERIPGISSNTPEGVPSPDGSQIVYVQLNLTTGNYDLFLYDVEEQSSDQVTFTDAYDAMPGWSPDGENIVFHSQMFNAEDQGDIVIYNFENQSYTNLTPDPPANFFINDQHPAWSPDNSKIVYSRYATKTELWITDPDGTNRQKLADNENVDSEPSWSPDGSEIVFARTHKLMIYNIDSQQVRPVSSTTSMPNHQRMPAWSPDGRWIAFHSYDDPADQSEIYMIRPDGTDLTLLTREASWGGGMNPSFIRIE